MTNDEILQRVKSSLQLCAGFDGDEVSKARKDALDAYFQRPRGDEQPGRAQVVTGDISAMVEANLAQMLDAFSSERIAEFDPLGAEDEDQAQLESDVVQYFVMSKSNGFLELAQSIKDALLMRNGLIKVYVDKRSRSFTRTFKNVTPEALAELTNAPGVETKILKYDAEKGDLSIRLTPTRKEFKGCALPVENFLYSPDWDELDLQDIPFCAERHIDSRSDLLEMGFPKAAVERLNRHPGDTKTDSAARNPQRLTANVQAVDSSQDQVEWFECYVLIDKDGDGISERRRVCISGDELLADEPANLVPYAAGTAIINPHRFLGISLYDKLKQCQDTNTALNRGLLDNVNTTTKNRLAYLDGKVNVEDVSDGRTNGAIRVKANVPDIRAAVMPFQVPDTSANILSNIQYQKTVRTEMGGAALDLQTAQMQIGGDRMGSQGLDRAYSVAEQLCAMMTKLVAASLIRSVYLLAHATLRLEYNEPVPIKRNGKWSSPVPSKWPERRCLTVKIGMSPGERARRAAALLTLLDTQVKLAQLGMDEVLVNLTGFYATLMDWARVSDIQNPEQYFVDPESVPAQQAIMSKQKAAAEQKAQQQALMQQAIELEQLKTAFEKYKTDAELQFKYYAEVLGAEIEEAKIAGKATTDLLAAKSKGKEKAANGEEKAGAAAEGQPAAA